MSNILIIGRRGLGKSILAYYQAEKLSPNKIIFDPGNQYQNVDFKTSDIAEFQQRLEEWPEDKSYSISYVSPRGNIESYWDIFAATLWDFVGQHKGAASFVLLVDEAHRIQSPQTINDALDEFIRRSPRRERGDSNPIDIIQTTHRPQDLHGVSWSESDYAYFFNVFDKRALKAVDEQYGTKIPNIVELISNLKTPKTGGREVLEIESETGQHRVITDPNEWFVDIKSPIPPANAMEALDRNLQETYGSL